MNGTNTSSPLQILASHQENQDGILLSNLFANNGSTSDSAGSKLERRIRKESDWPVWKRCASLFSVHLQHDYPKMV